MKSTYRPGQANSQFLLCQNSGIIVIFNTLKCGIFSKIKMLGLKYGQKFRFLSSKIAKLDLT